MTLIAHTALDNYSSNGASYSYSAPKEQQVRGWGGAAPVFNISNLFEAGLRQQLEKLKALPENWDAEGAEPISALTLKNAQTVGLRMLNRTRLPDDITPNNGDTLTFEWETNNGSALLVVGYSDYSFLMNTRSGKRTTEMGKLGNTADIDNLGALIQRSLF